MKDIIKKFKFRGKAIVIDAPAKLAAEFAALGCSSAFDNTAKSANTLVFIADNQTYLEFLNTQLSRIEPDSVLWFAYPKQTSNIKTDISRDTLRVTGEAFHITTVTAISINDAWSALRFRPVHRVGK